MYIPCSWYVGLLVVIFLFLCHFVINIGGRVDCCGSVGIQVLVCPMILVINIVQVLDLGACYM